MSSPGCADLSPPLYRSHAWYATENRQKAFWLWRSEFLAWAAYPGTEEAVLLTGRWMRCPPRWEDLAAGPVEMYSPAMLLARLKSVSPTGRFAWAIVASVPWEGG